MGGAVINTEKQSILLREFYRIGLNRGVRFDARKPDVAWQSCALGGSVGERKCGCLGAVGVAAVAWRNLILFVTLWCNLGRCGLVMGQSWYNTGVVWWPGSLTLSATLLL